MRACEMCGRRSEDVERHIVLGVWTSMCGECWRRYRQPSRLLKPGERP